jgi:hypothetical protein
MELFVKRITNLLKIKSLVTLALTAAFVYLCITGKISADQFLTVFTVVIAFYFGTQTGRKEDAEKSSVAVAKNATATEEVKS